MSISFVYVIAGNACPDDGVPRIQLMALEGGKLRPLTMREEASVEGAPLSSSEKTLLTALKKSQFIVNKDLLKLLAATTKLYYNGKRLVCDFFGQSKFEYKVSKSDKGELLLSAAIVENGKEIAVSSVEALRAGKPPFYIRQNMLRFIQEDIPWKHLKAFYSAAQLPVDDYWRDYLPELFKEHKQDPLPTLWLTDRAGAFANLKMDYGNNKMIAYQRSNSFAKIQDFRNTALEKQWESDLLETDFTYKPTGLSQYYCPVDKVAKSLTFLLELGWSIYDQHGKKILLCSHSNITAEIQASTILVKGNLQFGDYKANLKDIVGCFNRTEKFMTLQGNSVGLIPEKWGESNLEAIGLEAEWVDDALRVPKQKSGLLESLFEAADEQFIPENMLPMLQPKEAPFTASGDGFNGTLRPYQQQGLNWLAYLYQSGMHGLLADDMGLGKTVQVLAFISSIQPHDAPVLIVVPTSLVFNWKAEIARFMPHLKVYIHQGSERKMDASCWNADIVLTSYTLLRLDAFLFQNQNFHCLILDEAHFIKNATSQTSQAIFKIKADFRLSLTGTPIENNLRELWSQFHFLLPGLLGKYQDFSADVDVSKLDPRFLDRIKRQVKPFILRRRKKEVAPDLPEKIEQTVFIEMEPAQRALYDSFLAGARQNLISKVKLDGAKKHRLEIFEVLLRLRQICCHPALVAAKSGESEEVQSAKLDYLLDELETFQEEGAKVLIFSQFTSFLQKVSAALHEREYKFLYLDGQTKDRGVLVEKFQNDSSYSFFLISLKAGGVGLNLTAADYVLLLDPWWNDAVEQQAIDRAHRIGRQESVIAKRFIVLDSIEEKMMRLKEKKRYLADDLMEDSIELSEEDLIDLLEK